MRDRKVFYIALGSNIGSREKYLADARSAIAELPGTQCIGETDAEETEPLGPVAQPAFLNQMIAIETALSPKQLLEELHAIEDSAGRKRTERWGPRTLDLDIVELEGGAFSSETLVIPHPELPNREFWLRELAILQRQVRANG